MRIIVPLDDLDPLGRGRDAERGPVARGPVEAPALPRREEIGVVVADRQRGDVPVHVEHDVAVDVDEVVAEALLRVPS